MTFILNYCVRKWVLVFQNHHHFYNIFRQNTCDQHQEVYFIIVIFFCLFILSLIFNIILVLRIKKCCTIKSRRGKFILDEWNGMYMYRKHLKYLLKEATVNYKNRENTLEIDIFRVKKLWFVSVTLNNPPCLNWVAITVIFLNERYNWYI